MNLALWFHPDAEAELTDAADFYALQGPGLEASFIAEVERALEYRCAVYYASNDVHDPVLLK